MMDPNKQYEMYCEKEIKVEPYMPPTVRPKRPDAIRVERGDWYRASGDTVCATCGCDYYAHAQVGGYSWLNRLCNGNLVKL